jgi:hypothetical protein
MLIRDVVHAFAGAFMMTICAFGQINPTPPLLRA